MFDYLVVGAGFAGSVVAEQIASRLGKSVLVVERRPHVGGNAYDCFDDAGILVHRYGPHIFHTSAPRIVSYLSKFTAWRPYEHRVVAKVRDRLVPFPINIDTVNALYGTNYDSEALAAHFRRVAEPVSHPRTSEDAVVGKVGRELYELFFRDYTRKQWGLDPADLDASVAARVPARLDHDDRYFTDDFQAMPLRGYTRMFQRILLHPKIKILLNADYHDAALQVPHREVIFTGPIDEYFDYCFGKLPYRSLEFRHETHPIEKFQPAPVVNYPDLRPYTRITEFKQLTGQRHASTSIVYEFPRASGDPYYPIPRAANGELYRRYKALADDTPGVSFVGRLATYKYYNMDQVVGQALTLVDRLVTGAAAASAA